MNNNQVKKSSRNVIKNFWGMIIIAVFLLIMGIGGYINSFEPVDASSSWKYTERELEEQQEASRPIFIIMAVGGIGLVIVAFLYKSSGDNQINLAKILMKTKEEDSATKLEKLKKLYDEKVITKEEYEKKKKDLLEKM